MTSRRDINGRMGLYIYIWEIIPKWPHDNSLQYLARLIGC